MLVEKYLADISILSYAVVFIGGLLVSFTPCIYPLIPIIVGVIGTSREKSIARNFFLSLNYVLGMSVIFSILGMVAALTASIFGQIQSSQLAHLAVGGVIIIFALSLLDIIPLPTFLLARAGAGKVIRRGGIFTPFLMGIASGFIAAPCTSAVLGALLAYVAMKGNIFFGSTLLFCFGMGVGTLLLLIGTFTGLIYRIPRSERTMKIFQNILAFGMIILGGYFVYKAWILWN